MTAQDLPSFDLAVQFPASLSDDALSVFEADLAGLGLTLAIRRDEPGAVAAAEWLIPTISWVGFAKAFFLGAAGAAGGVAGKEAASAIKTAIGKLWARLSTVRVTIVTSAPEKAADNQYSRTFCLLTGSGSGRSVKLLVPANATREEMEAATIAFLDFAEAFHSEQSPPLTFWGGMAIVTYDPETATLREVDPRK